MAASTCPGLRLAAVSAVADNRDSLATFELPGGAQITRSFGGHVSEARVVFVGDHPTRGPSAWLLRERRLCQLALSATRAPQAALGPTHRAKQRGATGVLSRLEEVEPGRFRVDRSMLLALLEKPEALSRGLKGTVRGDAFVIRRLSNSAPLAQAGLRRGDHVVKVGGISVRDAQGLLRLLAGATRRSSLDLEVVRDGRPLSLNYRFE